MTTNLLQIANFHQAELQRKAAQERIFYSAKQPRRTMPLMLKSVLNLVTSIVH